MYGTLGLMIPLIGPDKSLLRPKSYLLIFLKVDFFSLLLQAVGGGLAGAAFSDLADPWPGTYTMVSGILFQLASTCAFTTLFEYVVYRALGPITRNPALAKEACTAASSLCRVGAGICLRGRGMR